MKKLILVMALTSLCSISYGQQNQNGQRPPRGPQLSDEQKVCVDGQVELLIQSGKIQDGQRASREVMGAIMDSCGVEKPPRPGNGDRRSSNQQGTSGTN